MIFSEELVYFEIQDVQNEKEEKLVDFGVLDNNNFYYQLDENTAFYTGIMDNFDDEPIYQINSYDQFNNLIVKEIGLTYKTAISFNSKTKQIKIFKNEKVIIEKQIEFCNNNNVCEYCTEDDCYNKEVIVYENSLTCQNDCPTGTNDNYCDLIQDNKCDPDCNNLDKDCNICNDPDNEDVCYYNDLNHYCMYEYDGIKCNSEQKCKQGLYQEMEDNTQCCIDSYCVALDYVESDNDNNNKDLVDEFIEDEILDEVIDEEVEKGKIESNEIEDKEIDQKEIEKYTKEQIIDGGNIKMYLIILAMFILVVIIINLFKFFKKTKTNKLDETINKLHNQGINYSKIKQQLIRKGHHDDEIDKAIESHYKKESK